VGNLIEHAALVLGVAALGAAGLRLAAAAGATGLVRPIAAAVAAVAAAVLEALALGLGGLGGSAPALLAAAVATWAAARLLPAPPVPGVLEELSGWWSSARHVARAAAGAAVVVPLGWAAWQLRYPYVGTDGLTYHLPLASEWASAGRAAALTPVLDGLPVENYPVTNEVALSWMLGLSGSWVAASVWSPALMVLRVAAGRLGLRELRVPGRTAWLALVALATLPIAATQLGAPNTDVPTLAWLVVAAALAAAGRAKPELLAFALVAAGLSFGTKTTGAVALAAALGSAAWAGRDALRALWRPLGLAALAAVGVGGLWALRNTALHGSPLWPLVASSFGDPVPRTLAPFQASFISRPREMLDGRLVEYATVLGGGVVLLAAGLAAPVLGRSPASAAAGVLVALMALAWSAAPYTGIASDTALAVGAVRYLLPCLAVCCVALALAARDGGPRARAAVDASLGLAALVSLARTAQLGFPLVPGAGTVVSLGLLGALVGVGVGRRASPPRMRRFVGVAVPVAAGVLAAAGLTLGAQGYSARHVALEIGDQRLLAAALARPEYAQGRFPIAMAPATNALLAGDELAHPVRLIPGGTSCTDVRRQRREGWVVLQRLPSTPQYRRLAACLRDDPPVFSDAGYELHAG
jgi:hypothetical protein